MEEVTTTVRITLFNLLCPDNFSEDFPDPEDLLPEDHVGLFLSSYLCTQLVPPLGELIDHHYNFEKYSSLSKL